MAAWGAYIGALNGAGVVVNGHGLLPPQMGTTIRLRDGKRLVQDGPYADTKEHLGGYFVIEAPSLDVALTWAGESALRRHGQCRSTACVASIYSRHEKP